MNKKLVLATVAEHGFPITPDVLRSICLTEYARTSVYVYLLRLKQQKLVERTVLGKRIAYRITKHGVERLEYFRRKDQ